MIDEIEYIREKIGQYEWFKGYYLNSPDELNIPGAPKKETINDMLEMFNRILSVLERDQRDRDFESMSMEDGLKP